MNLITQELKDRADQIRKVLNDSGIKCSEMTFTALVYLGFESIFVYEDDEKEATDLALEYIRNICTSYLDRADEIRAAIRAKRESIAKDIADLEYNRIINTIH